MAPIRNRPSTLQALRLVRAMALVFVIATLLATSCTADEAVTDLEMRCQNVQCYSDCPTDSFLVNPLDTNDAKEDETEPSETSTIPSDAAGRVRRAIAMNNHAHGPIKIIPIALQFFYPNNLQPQRRLKRDIDPTELVEAAMDYSESEPHLQDLCCPKCVCQPCPELPSCPPNFKLTIDPHEQTGLPGKCCPSYQCEPLNQCHSKKHQAYYQDNEIWQETACTTCRCEAGLPRCEMPACKPLNCEHQIRLPDRCCPVCDAEKSIFCEDHNCELRCRNGYERRGACALCRCVQPSANTTDPTTPDDKTTETTALVANFTSADGTTTHDIASKGELDADEGLFNRLPNFVWFLVIILAILSASIILFRMVTVECLKKGLKMLFTCNQIPQRKSAYNRVSSTVPVTAPANGTAANSMA